MQRKISKKSRALAIPTSEQIIAAMRRTVQRIRRMSHAERVQSLKEAGILTAKGQLAPRYR